MEALLCGQTTYPASTFAVTWKNIHRAELNKQFEVLFYVFFWFETCSFLEIHRIFTLFIYILDFKQDDLRQMLLFACITHTSVK